MTNTSTGNAIIAWTDARAGAIEDIYANLATHTSGGPGIPGFTLVFVGLGVLTLMILFSQKNKEEF